MGVFYYLLDFSAQISIICKVIGGIDEKLYRLGNNSYGKFIIIDAHHRVMVAQSFRFTTDKDTTVFISNELWAAHNVNKNKGI